MTFSSPMSRKVHDLVDRIRDLAFTDGPDERADRVLAGVTLLAGGAVMLWPKGRKLPIPPEHAARAVYVARYLYARRHWWLPGAEPVELRRLHDQPNPTPPEEG